MPRHAKTSGHQNRREGPRRSCLWFRLPRWDRVMGMCFAGDLWSNEGCCGPAATHYTLCILLCALATSPPTLPSLVGTKGDGGGIRECPDLEVGRELGSFFPQSNDL